MMKRRTAMIVLSGARLLGLHLPVGAFGAPQAETGEDLAKALQQLGSRVYSEEGIPMFLVCENVSAEGRPGAKQQAVLTDLNKVVASAFRRYASDWQRLRKNANAADVAKIVEYLAHRDFAAGGKEKSL